MLHQRSSAPMNAVTTPPSLRKVAIVLASLDNETADALIDQMSAERASQVRRAMIELEQLDPAEQEEIVGEFLRHGQATKRASHAGVELEAGLAERLEFEGATYQADQVAAQQTPASEAAPEEENS